MVFLTAPGSQTELGNPLCDPQRHKQRLYTWLLLLPYALSHPQDLGPLKGMDHIFIAVAEAPGKVPGLETSKMLEG